MNIINKFKEIFSVPKNNAVFTTINLLLGVGPIIIPQPFFEAGFILSFIWFAVIFWLSYNSACYIGESIQRIGGHLYSDTSDYKQSLIEAVQEKQTQSGTGQIKTIRVYDHTEQFKILFGERWKLFPAIAISIYLFGVSVSKCIMTGKTLSKLLADIPVLNAFQFWLGVFFVSGASFSFKSIEKTKALQIFIVVVRFLSILLMIVGAFIIMGQNGYVQTFIPQNGGAFNLQFFPDLFSNLVFSLLCHHSLPGISRQLTSLKHIRYFVLVAFLTAGAVLISIPVTAMMAFGNDLIHPQNKFSLMDVHKLIYYNQDFKGRLDFVYYVVSFYQFLNVAAFSIYIIVIRNNILSVAKPEIDANRLSKTTLLFSLALLGCILVVSYALRQSIQVALSFTGGLFGCVILMIIPPLQVYQARKLTNHKPRFWWIPFVIIALGVVFMVFNMYMTISNLAK